MTSPNAQHFSFVCLVCNVMDLYHPYSSVRGGADRIGRPYGRAFGLPCNPRCQFVEREPESSVGTMTTSDTTSLARRRILLLASTLTLTYSTPSLAFASSPKPLTPSSPTELLRVLDEAPGDSVTDIFLGPGEWRFSRTLDVRTPVVLRGSTDPANPTTIVLDTDDHYVPALTVTSSDTTIESLSIRHRSPSVANNYAIYLQNASDVTLRRLDVSSTTGTGVAIEGGRGTLDIVDCVIHDTKNNGIGLFPDVLADDTDDTDEESRLRIRVSSTRVADNGKEAIVGRGLGEGVTVRVEDSGMITGGAVEFFNCEDADVAISL